MTAPETYRADSDALARLFELAQQIPVGLIGKLFVPVVRYIVFLFSWHQSLTFVFRTKKIAARFSSLC